VKFGHVGVCPFCSETVKPVLFEEGKIFRDTYKCDNCNNKIMYCRSPGCQDYTKWGEIIKDDFCPECTRAISSGVTSIGVGALSTVVGILIGKKFEK